jgi:quercetin dioxygenase-like cupin family protein
MRLNDDDIAAVAAYDAQDRSGGSRDNHSIEVAMLKILVIIPLLLTVNAIADVAMAPQAERQILERHDQSGVAGKEIVSGKATFPPGAIIGFHTHPGDEAGYVVKGSVTWKTRGKDNKLLKAGDSFFNPRGFAHSLVAGSEGATVVATWIVDKDVPMASPSP